MFLIILNYLHYIDVDRRIVIFVIAELIIIYLYLIIYFPLNLQTLFIKTAYCLHLFCLSVPFSIQFWPTCVRYCLEISGVRINVETRSAKPRVKRLSTARVASPQLEKIEVWRDARAVRPLESALFRRAGGGVNQAPKWTSSRGDRTVRPALPTPQRSRLVVGRIASGQITKRKAAGQPIREIALLQQQPLQRFRG